MPAPAKPRKPKAMGRPRNPESEKLCSYGLHLAPDKKSKMLEIKDYEGVTVRAWIEDHIERDWLAMKERRAEQRADATKRA